MFCKERLGTCNDKLGMLNLLSDCSFNYFKQKKNEDFFLCNKRIMTLTWVHTQFYKN